MKALRDLPIKAKLKLLLGLTGGIALVICSASFILSDLSLIQSFTIRSLDLAADALRLSATEALKRDDPKAGQEVLRVLLREPSVIAACIYDKKGRVFATFGGRTGEKFWVPAPKPDGTYIADGHIEIFRTIRDAGQEQGTLLIRSNTRQMNQVLRTVTIVGASLLGSLLTAILLSSKLQQVISRPILRLVEAVRAVRSKGTLAIRVPKDANDELGVLSDGFNAMMEQLEQRDDELEKRRQQSLEARHLTIFSMAKLAEKRSLEMGLHLERIRTYARLLAAELSHHEEFRGQIGPEFIEMIYLTSPLHDIGKVGVPDGVLLKPGELTPEEFQLMKLHTTIGSEAIEDALQQHPGVGFLKVAREIAATHHERFDGTGYPKGLAGDAIPLSGRIVALADVYDALTTERVYKEAVDPETARATIVAETGKQFDPRVVQAFLAVQEQFLLALRQFAEKSERGSRRFAVASPKAALSQIESISAQESV